MAAQALSDELTSLNPAQVVEVAAVVVVGAV
jgi:hypothetical protein